VGDGRSGHSRANGFWRYMALIAHVQGAHFFDLRFVGAQTDFWQYIRYFEAKPRLVGCRLVGLAQAFEY